MLMYLKCVGICKECDHYKNCIKSLSGINRVLDENKWIYDDGFYKDAIKIK